MDITKIEKIIKFSPNGRPQIFIPGSPFSDEDFVSLESGKGYIVFSKREELGDGYLFCQNIPAVVRPPTVDDSLLAFGPQAGDFVTQDEISLNDKVLDTSLSDTGDGVILSTESDDGVNKIVPLKKDPDFVPTPIQKEQWIPNGPEFIDPAGDRDCSTFGSKIKTNSDLSKVLISALDDRPNDDCSSDENDADIILIELDKTKNPNEWEVKTEIPIEDLVDVDASDEIDTIVGLGGLDSPPVDGGIRPVIVNEPIVIDDTFSPTSNALGFGSKIQMSDRGDRFATSIDVLSNDNNPNIYIKENTLINNNYADLGDRTSYDSFMTNNAHTFAFSKSNDTVAIGDPTDNNSTGKVRVFKWNGALWSELGSGITGSGQQVNFGRDISINFDGTILAIGAEDYGAVYIWNTQSTSWTQLGTDITSSSPSNTFSSLQDKLSPQISNDGLRVLFAFDALDGKYLHSISNRESFAVYEWNATSWQLAADVFDKQDDWVFDMGSPGKDMSDYPIETIRFSGDGTKVVFSQPEETVQVARRDLSDTSVDHNGRILRDSNNNIIYDGNIRGAVWVLEIGNHPPNTLGMDNPPVSQMGKVWQMSRRIYGEDTGSTVVSHYHTFGKGLAINHDASVIAVGNPKAIGDGTAATQNNFPFSVGIVKIFHWYNDSSYQSGDWISVPPEDLDNTQSPIGNSVSKVERFGESLSVSDDGSTVAIGDPKAKSNNGGEGYIKIMKIGEVACQLNIQGKDLLGDSYEDIKIEGSFSVPCDARPESIAVSHDGLLLAVGFPNYLFNAEDGRNGAILIFSRSAVGDAFKLSQTIHGETYESGQGTIKGEKLGLRLEFAFPQEKYTLYATGNTSISLDGSKNHRAINDPYNAKGTLKAIQFNSDTASWETIAKIEEFYGISQNASEQNGRSSGNTGFGYSLSANGLGNFVAVGAPWVDTVNEDITESDNLSRQKAEMGAIYVLELDTSGPEAIFIPTSKVIGTDTKETISYSDPTHGNVNIQIGYQLGLTSASLTCMGEYLAYAVNRKTYIKRNENFDSSLIKNENDVPDGILYRLSDIGGYYHHSGDPYLGETNLAVCEPIDLMPTLHIKPSFGKFNAKLYEGEYDQNKDIIRSTSYFEGGQARELSIEDSCPLLQETKKNLFRFKFEHFNKSVHYQKFNLVTTTPEPGVATPDPLQPECLQSLQYFSPTKVTIVYSSDACPSYKIIRSYRIDSRNALSYPDNIGVGSIKIDGGLVETYSATLSAKIISLNIPDVEPKRTTIDINNLSDIPENQCGEYPTQSVCSVTSQCYSIYCGSCYDEYLSWQDNGEIGSPPACTEDPDDYYLCDARGDCWCGSTFTHESYADYTLTDYYVVELPELDGKGSPIKQRVCCNCISDGENAGVADDPNETAYSFQPPGSTRLNDCDNRFCSAEYDRYLDRTAECNNYGSGYPDIKDIEFGPLVQEFNLRRFISLGDREQGYDAVVDVKLISANAKVKVFNQTSHTLTKNISYTTNADGQGETTTDTGGAGSISVKAIYRRGSEEALRESRVAGNKSYQITNISDTAITIRCHSFPNGVIGSYFGELTGRGPFGVSTDSVTIPAGNSVFILASNSFEADWIPYVNETCEHVESKNPAIPQYVHAQDGFHWPPYSVKVVRRDDFDEGNPQYFDSPPAIDSIPSHLYNDSAVILLPPIEEATSYFDASYSHDSISIGDLSYEQLIQGIGIGGPTGTGPSGPVNIFDANSRVVTITPNVCPVPLNEQFMLIPYDPTESSGPTSEANPIPTDISENLPEDQTGVILQATTPVPTTSTTLPVPTTAIPSQNVGFTLG